MNRYAAYFLAKILELLVIVTLLRAYGPIFELSQVWAKFVAMPDLSQIGTITCLAVIFGVTIAALNKIFFMFRQAAMAAIKVVKHMASRLRGGR